PELEAPQNPLADAVEADDLRASVHAVSMLLDSRLAPGSRFIADDQLTGVEDQLLELCQELCPKAATSLKYAVTQRRHRKASRSNRYNAQLYLESLLHILFDERRRAEPERQATVKDLVNELHRHPAKMWTLREASQILGVSLSYASKRFKAETGKSFINYVTDMRIERAKLMLAHTDMPAQRVAKELGFPPNYLSRVFKQVTGMTPSEYRAKNT
ncbi:MAG: helix-turn-helix transcriptional regulator, partial [Propionibacteriaceae bacterium]|nr:helix-turn-helix transcriptional regulator [Propionibacteriaceae bacterium]